MQPIYDTLSCTLSAYDQSKTHTAVSCLHATNLLYLVCMQPIYDTLSCTLSGYDHSTTHTAVPCLHTTNLRHTQLYLVCIRPIYDTHSCTFAAIYHTHSCALTTSLPHTFCTLSAYDQSTGHTHNTVYSAYQKIENEEFSCVRCKCSLSWFRHSRWCAFNQDRSLRCITLCHIVVFSNAGI